MKIKQAHLKKDFDSTALSPLMELQPQLVLAFGGIRFFEDGQLGVRLRKLFPQAVIAGCSSAGEIVNDSAVYDDTLVLTAVSASDTRFTFATAPIGSAEASRAAGIEAAKNLGVSDALKSVFVLAPGLNVNGSMLVEGLASVLGSDVVVTGGLAGDGGRFQKTYTLVNDKVSDNALVVVGMASDSIKVGYGSRGGWEPFGLERRVTRASSNVLYELDGKPALKLYKEYLGDKAKELPASGLFYPLSVMRSGESGGLIRTILNVDEEAGSLVLAGDVPEGSVVRLMHTKSNGLVQGALRASNEAHLTGASDAQSLGILISCVGRKIVMGHDVDEEIEVVKDNFGPQCTVTGFYSYGEIFAFDQKDRTPYLHNQTMTITCLSQTK
jgi:hypothetical protein